MSCLGCPPSLPLPPAHGATPSATLKFFAQPLSLPASAAASFLSPAGWCACTIGCKLPAPAPPDPVTLPPMHAHPALTQSR